MPLLPEAITSCNPLMPTFHDTIRSSYLIFVRKLRLIVWSSHSVNGVCQEKFMVMAKLGDVFDAVWYSS